MTDFKIVQCEKNGINIIELKGFLDAHTAPELEDTFQKLIKNKKYKIIVNFRDLSYISSAGLGVFMAFIEEVRKNEGDIKLTNMTPKVFNVFDLLGFPILYEIYGNEEDAISKFLKDSENKDSMTQETE